jgi:hypothetical protein
LVRLLNLTSVPFDITHMALSAERWLYAQVSFMKDSSKLSSDSWPKILQRGNCEKKKSALTPYTVYILAFGGWLQA